MFDTDVLAAAAAARGAEIAARADRPSQRRSAAPLGSGFAVSTRASVEIREAAEGDALHFHGLASAYERGYEMFDFWGPYTEIVSAGAGAKSLARGDLDVPLVLQHNQLRRIARTTNGSLTLSETPEGLEVDAPNLDPRDSDVDYIVRKIRAGLIDEMSFAFRIIRGEWSPDWTTYRIDEFEIHRGDVAIVGFGANPYTVSDLRGAATPPPAPTREADDVAAPAVDEFSPVPFVLI